MKTITSNWYHKLVLMVAIFFMVSSLNAQNIDSEFIKDKYAQISRYKNLKQQQDSLHNLSRQITRLPSDKALPLFTVLDSLVTKEQLKLTYLKNWGTTEARSGNSDLSKKLRIKGLSIAKKLEDDSYQFTYNIALSNHYINISQVDSAMYFTKEAEKIHSLYPEKFDNLIWTVYQRYYNIQGILGNVELQDDYIEKSWESLKGYPNHSMRGYTLFLITDHFRKRKNYVKQAQYADLLIAYYNKKKLTTPDYHFPVESVLITNDSPEAINDLKRVVQASDSINNLNALSFTATTLAKVLLEKKRADEAIPILKRTIFKLDSANYAVGNSGVHDLLQQAYAQKKDYKSAFNTLQIQKQIEDSLRSSELLNKVADFEVRYQTQETERALEKKKADQKLLVWILGLGALTLVLLSFFFIKNQKQKVLLQKQTKLLTITIDEKNTLLKEVHHRVKNSFQIVSSLLYLQSENVTDKKAKTAIKEAENRVRSMVLVHQKLYNKDELVGINATEYINDLVKDIFESHDIQKEPISYKLNVEALVLDIETITPLGLIINELIINTMKHAFTGIETKNSINVDFAKINDELILKVSDNGKGFEGEIKQTSFGIMLMKALSRQLKATLNYKSAPNQGTEAILRISKFTILS